MDQIPTFYNRRNPSGLPGSECEIIVDALGTVCRPDITGVCSLYRGKSQYNRTSIPFW